MHFIVAYEDAVEYMNSHRNIEPAIYNEARLLEIPIPEFHQVEEVEVHADNDGSLEANLVADVSTSQGDNTSAIDPLSVEPENTNENELENHETNQNEQKSNIPLLGLRVANNNNVLNFIEDDDEDDVEIISFEGEQFEMTLGRKGFAMPQIMLPDERIKRENDEISGSEPYYFTVSINIHEASFY